MTTFSLTDNIKLKIEEIKPEIVIKQEEPMESREKTLNEKTEKDASTSVRNSFKVRKKCCVCGEMNQKYKMTMAPKLKKVLLKWSQVFGQKFYKTCWKNKPFNQYICSIHWEQLRDDWKGPLPEVLKKMKKENNGSFKVVMFLNDIDEEGKDEFLQKYLCTYCSIKLITKDMTTVPKNEEKLLKWAKNLGKEFLENVQKHNRNMICWSHFKYRNSHNRNADNLPLTDEMRNVNNNDNKIMNGIDELGKKQSQKFSCRYCGAKCIARDMTVVPKNVEQLMDWTKILGEDFLKNVRTHKTNWICRSHFKYPENHRTKFDLPITDKIMNEEMANDEDHQKYSCRYCGTKKIAKEMTFVPTSEAKLMKWAKRLGEDFLNNVRAHTVNRICWSHFKYHDSKCRNAHILLMTDEIMKDQLNNFELEVENVKPEIVVKQEEPVLYEKCRYCGVSRKIDGLVIVPNNRYTLARWVKSLGVEFFKNLTIGSTNYICWGHFNSPDSIKPYHLECLPKNKNLVNISNYGELQDMKSEEKPDVKIPKLVVQKEEENGELDEMEMNGMFSVSDNAHSTNFLIEKETKP